MKKLLTLIWTLIALLPITAAHAEMFASPFVVSGSSYKLLGSTLSSGYLQVDGSGVLSSFPLPVTKVLYVDKGRSDSYTEDGTLLKPFKTIMGAVNQIIANADNASYTYKIDVLGPGNYLENVTLNSALLSVIAMDCHGAAFIAPASGLALASTANNDNFSQFVTYGCSFAGGITLTGASNATNFMSGTWQFTNASITGATNVTNAKFLNIVDSQINSDINWTNVTVGIIAGGQGSAPATASAVVTNGAANKPASFTTTQILMEKTIAGADVNCGVGSLCMYREGARVGYPGGSIVCDGTCQVYTSYVRSNLSGSGTLSLLGSTYAGTNTVTTYNHAGHTGFSSVVSGSAAQPATNAVLVVDNGHIKSTQTTAPTVAVHANAGTGATCSIVSGSSDTIGKINLTTTAVAPAAGTQCTLTFNKAFNVAPICTPSPQDDNSILFSVTNGSRLISTTTTMTINYANADAVGHANVEGYTCVEPQ